MRFMGGIGTASSVGVPSGVSVGSTPVVTAMCSNFAYICAGKFRRACAMSVDRSWTGEGEGEGAGTESRNIVI